MLHHKLQDLEAELAIAEKSRANLNSLTPECAALLSFVENEIELKLADKVPREWKGWISYRRREHDLIILRGRSFKEGFLSISQRAGFDVAQGADSISEIKRGFDVSPPQELDHLLLNFGRVKDETKLFLWYGQNTAPYKLIFTANVADEPHHELSEAIAEACVWIAKRPKHQTLDEFLKTL